MFTTQTGVYIPQIFSPSTVWCGNKQYFLEPSGISLFISTDFCQSSKYFNKVSSNHYMNVNDYTDPQLIQITLSLSSSSL